MHTNKHSVLNSLHAINMKLDNLIKAKEETNFSLEDMIPEPMGTKEQLDVFEAKVAGENGKEMRRKMVNGLFFVIGWAWPQYTIQVQRL